MIIFQVFLPVFLIGMIDKKGIDRKPVILAASTKYLVNLIRGNKETALGGIILGGGKDDRFPTQISQFLQQFFRAVVAKAHQLTVLLMGFDKFAPFLRNLLQHIRVFQQFKNLLFNLREAAFCRQGKAEGWRIARIPGLLRKISGSQSKAFRKGFSLIVRHTVKLMLRHIPPQIQQFPDTLGGIFPGQKRSIAILRTASGRYPDTLRIIPEGIFPVIDIKACPVGSVVLRKESGIFLRRMVFHKIRTDNQAAVAVIGTNAKGFVNHLLG